MTLRRNYGWPINYCWTLTIFVTAVCATIAGVFAYVLVGVGLPL